LAPHDGPPRRMNARVGDHTTTDGACQNSDAGASSRCVPLIKSRGPVMSRLSSLYAQSRVKARTVYAAAA
jgi:hypothetical protein